MSDKAKRARGRLSPEGEARLRERLYRAFLPHLPETVRIERRKAAGLATAGSAKRFSPGGVMALDIGLTHWTFTGAGRDWAPNSKKGSRP